MTADNWPENRYSKRLPLRLRRRSLHNPGWTKIPGALAIAPAAADPAPAADPAAAAAQQETIDKLREQLLRLQAEFENYRRRTRKEVEDIRQTAAGSVLESLLPVADNFGRALMAPATSLEGYAEGIKMIHGHFMNLLRDAGLERIDAVGKPFDPNQHEAVAMDHSGAQPENSVVEVLQDGYMLRGKLLRPAMVKVARAQG